MTLKRLAAPFALLACVALTGAAKRDWNGTVVRTDGGHAIGRPDAPNTLTEFISYTCPACGNFARTGDEALKIAYISPGNLRLEIRHIVRDPVDLTAALLTWCGDAARFPRNHAAIMYAQPRWMAVWQSSTAAQRQRWTSGDLPSRTRAIAADLGFYPIMEARGYSRVQLDRCLADTALARRLAENSDANIARFNVAGTPSFALDGALLPDVHSWDALQRRLGAPL
ncbi:DsbA family protein [Leptolyngbya sp. 15MV]|nr:DsbA family protein [Leptolyngbya sp. 15MV]